MKLLIIYNNIIWPTGIPAKQISNFKWNSDIKYFLCLVLNSKWQILYYTYISIFNLLIFYLH